MGMAQLLSSGHLIAKRFAICEVAGSGGMGTVYRARDLQTGAATALKLLHSTGGNSAEAERFVREAKLLSELLHPGIVSYVAHGLTEEGRPFLAMEWLEGEDLAQHLRHGLLTATDSVSLIRQVAEALAVAHQRGIVHRDLKPSNLTADRNGTANAPPWCQVRADKGLGCGSLSAQPLHFLRRTLFVEPGSQLGLDVARALFS